MKKKVLIALIVSAIVTAVMFMGSILILESRLGVVIPWYGWVVSVVGAAGFFCYQYYAFWLAGLWKGFADQLHLINMLEYTIKSLEDNLNRSKLQTAELIRERKDIIEKSMSSEGNKFFHSGKQEWLTGPEYLKANGINPILRGEHGMRHSPFAEQYEKGMTSQEFRQACLVEPIEWQVDPEKIDRAEGTSDRKPLDLVWKDVNDPSKGVENRADQKTYFNEHRLLVYLVRLQKEILYGIIDRLPDNSFWDSMKFSERVKYENPINSRKLFDAMMMNYQFLCGTIRVINPTIIKTLPKNSWYDKIEKENAGKCFAKTPSFPVDGLLYSPPIPEL